jgi:predicted AAA+ superfamily ATPase
MPRETIMEQIRPFVGTDIVKVITGLRQSGKSVLLDLLRE